MKLAADTKAHKRSRKNCKMLQEMTWQPVTQLLDGFFEMEEEGHMEGVYGSLYPHSGTCPRLALTQEMFRLGQAKTSNYVIREFDIGGHHVAASG